MHYIFKASEGPERSEVETPSVVTDCNELKLVAPRAWVAKGNPRLGESSIDLHHGLGVSEDEIDTVPGELVDDLFNAFPRS